MVNQLYENHLVRKGDACLTELHFRNIKLNSMQEAKGSTRDTSKMSTVEMQIAERLRKYPDEALTNLNQFIDEDLLEEGVRLLYDRSVPG